MLCSLRKKINNPWLTLFFLIFFCLSENVHADAPFLTDSAATFEPRQSQIILYGIALTSNAGNTYFAPAIEYDFGVAPDFEIDTLSPYIWDTGAPPQSRSVLPNASGLSDIDIELKYRVLHETAVLPQISIGPNFFLPTGNGKRGTGNGRFWFYVPLVFEKNFGTAWRTYFQAGYAMNSAPGARNFFLWGYVLQRNISDKLMLGGEIFYQGAGTVLAADKVTLLNLGFVYNFTPRLSLQASIGHSISGLNAWQAYAGLGWA